MKRGDALFAQLEQLTPEQLRILIVRLYLKKFFKLKDLFKAAEGK